MGYQLDGVIAKSTSSLGGCVQVVDFDPGVGHISYDPEEGVDEINRTPSLLVAEGGRIHQISLSSGESLSFTLGDRYCVGAYTGDTHQPCDNPEAPACPGHTDTWRCARCTGNCELPLPSCTDVHAVYLAAFAPRTFKIGVTRLNRVSARLLEQGADFGAHIHTVSNGRIARQLEQDYARDIPDRIAISEKLMSLVESVDLEAWRALLADFTVLETFDLEYGLSLQTQPVQETLATGTVLGVKGRLLVLENGGVSYVVDTRDLLGHELLPVATDRELQSSLGKFG